MRLENRTNIESDEVTSPHSCNVVMAEIAEVEVDMIMVMEKCVVLTSS
jgi:hypothetical protein